MADRTSLNNIITIIGELKRALATENLSESDRSHLEMEISRLEQEKRGIEQELRNS